MGTWFDKVAKRSAGATVDSGENLQSGLTRRQVLARGAVVTGAAWTAPMLLGVRPAFAGASQCKPTEDFVTCPDGTLRCCPDEEVCGRFPNGDLGCDIPLGGICGNRGQGVDTCNFGKSRCNQPASNQDAEPICGGAGAVCDPTLVGPVCVDGVQCSSGAIGGDKRCGGQGAVCNGNEDCADRTVNQPATTCQGGVCTAV